jgi:hypothetical protein
MLGYRVIAFERGPLGGNLIRQASLLDDILS